MSFSAVNVCRFENGKVAEIWNHRDDWSSSESRFTRVPPPTPDPQAPAFSSIV
jgi:hypothetical protein